jgi:hypothetical protein
LFTNGSRQQLRREPGVGQPISTKRSIRPCKLSAFNGAQADTGRRVVLFSSIVGVGTAFAADHRLLADGVLQNPNRGRAPAWCAGRRGE